MVQLGRWLNGSEQKESLSGPCRRQFFRVVGRLTISDFDRVMQHTHFPIAFSTFCSALTASHAPLVNHLLDLGWPKHISNLHALENIFYEGFVKSTLSSATLLRLAKSVEGKRPSNLVISMDREHADHLLHQKHFGPSIQGYLGFWIPSLPKLKLISKAQTRESSSSHNPFSILSPD